MPINSDALKDSVELPNLHPKPKRPGSNGDPEGNGKAARHTQATDNAHNQTVQNQAALTLRTQKQMGQIDAALTKIANERDAAIEHVSDTLSYLYSPATFQAEVLQRTQEKLGMGQQPQQAEPVQEVITLDDLSGVFSDLANSIEYPALTPHPCAGALPM